MYSQFDVKKKKKKFVIILAKCIFYHIQCMIVDDLKI